MTYALLTAAAVALLGLLHLVLSRRAAGDAQLAQLRRGLAAGGDPWARLLVAGALAAVLFAGGVVVVPALLDDDDGGSTLTGTEPPTTTVPTATEPTTTEATTTAPTTTEVTTTTPTTTPEPTTTTPTTTEATTTAPTSTEETTTAPTTTAPTTTSPTPPPAGKIVLARATVDGSDARVVASVSKVGSQLIVRRVAVGVYRVLVPGLSESARGRATVRVHAAAGTQASVQKPAGTPTLIVLTHDLSSGAPASRDFTLTVYGVRADIPRKLPKTT